MKTVNTQPVNCDVKNGYIKSHFYLLEGNVGTQKDNDLRNAVVCEHSGFFTMSVTECKSSRKSVLYSEQC